MKKAVAILLWFQFNEHYAPRILLTRRKRACSGFVGYHAVPGGAVDDNEFISRAIQRELREETELNLLPIDYELIECIEEGEWQCFFYETTLSEYRFDEIKNVEPSKHTPWKLYTIEEALKLKLIPSIRQILLTRQEKYRKLKQRKS